MDEEIPKFARYKPMMGASNDVDDDKENILPEASVKKRDSKRIKKESLKFLKGSCKVQC